MDYLSNEEVLKLATKLHFGQCRWDGEPYIGHPVAVAQMVEDFLSDFPYETLEHINCAIQTSYLHDVLEDCPVTSEQLLKYRIDPLVIAYCELLNKKKYSCYAEYISTVSNSYYPSVVKYFDIKHNSISLGLGTKLDKYQLAQLVLTTKHPSLHKWKEELKN